MHSQCATHHSVIHVHNTQHVPTIGCKGQIESMCLRTSVSTSKGLNNKLVANEVAGITVFRSAGSKPVHNGFIIITLCVVWLL